MNRKISSRAPSKFVVLGTSRSIRKCPETRRWKRFGLDEKWLLRCLVALASALWAFVALNLARRYSIGLPLDFQVYRDASLNMLHRGATYRSHYTFAHLNFTYPPIGLLLLSTFAVVPATVALAIWWSLSVGALIVLVAVVLQTLTTLPRTLTIATSCALSGASCLFLEPVRSNLEFGQINIFLMLLVVLDIFKVSSNRKGLLTGLAAAIKLTPLIYITYFLVTRARSSALRAVGTFLGVTALAWALLPADSTVYWLHQAFSPGHKGGDSGPMNQSWFGLIGHYFQATNSPRIILWSLLSGATFVLGVSLAKRYVTTERHVEALLTLALTELLVSPISWTHHWLWIVLLPVIWIARIPRRHVVNVAMLLLIVVAVAAPYKWHLTGWLSHSPLSVFVGFSLLFSGALLLIVMALVERSWRAQGSDELVASRARELCEGLVSGDV